MFERLGEIEQNNERFSSENEEPEVFLWFPLQSKFDYIPPNLVSEGLEFQLDRVVKLAKAARSDLSQVTGGHLNIEEQIIRFFEVKDEVKEFLQMLKDCEADPAAKEDASMEKIAKAKHILDELNSAINETKTETFAQKMKVENEFNVGMEKNLIPWIDDMERESLKQLEKPDNFEHAREIEKQSVVFAKEVRKANKLLQTLETSIEKLPDKKMWAGQQLGEQKVRFKNIATVAATRVETMRDLLVNWNFFMETKGEIDRLSETTWKMFEATPLSDEFKIDENDFVHGLPKIMLGWLHLAESIMNNPPKPSNFNNSLEVHDLMKKFCAVSELANKQLEKIEECTEKTPSHQQVWDQRGRMKKILQKTKIMTARLEALGSRWKCLQDSEVSDNLDFQPIVQFLHHYTECYA